MSTIVITGANDAYFDLLTDLLDSIDANASALDVSIGVYDFGLRAENASILADRGAQVVDPGWDIPFRGVEQTPGYKKYVTAAPFAPKHFPGFDVYVWIDADAWVQTEEGLDLLIRGARRTGMAACKELDRHYPNPLAGGRVQTWPFIGASGVRRGVVTWKYKMFRHLYSRRIANETFFQPVVNAGVYAIAADAPHWAAWERSLRAARYPDASQISDQVPLNHAIHVEQLAVEYLPARCNWLCSLAEPVWDPSRKQFVEPMLPHAPIGVVHLINKAKSGVASLATVDGALVRGGLRYRDRPEQ